MRPLFESEAFVRVAAPVAVGIVLFALWEVGFRLASVPVYLFPKPSDIFASFVHNGPSLLRALLVTLRVTLQAFVAAVILGTLVAFMFVQSRAIEVSLFPYAVLLQVTPVVAIAPLVIILVKNTQASLTICATLVALGSLTAQAPVSVAKGEIELSPVQPWQLTQAPSNTILPRASAVLPPSRCDAGAGGASVAGKSVEAVAGTVRR